MILSPLGNSAIFAAITADAKIQVWDLSDSRTEPYIVFDTMKDDAEFKHDCVYFQQDEATSLQRYSFVSILLLIIVLKVCIPKLVLYPCCLIYS